jgi:hypothetical protein
LFLFAWPFLLKLTILLRKGDMTFKKIDFVPLVAAAAPDE